MATSACVKEVNRSASVAFAPDAPCLAAGTMAGAVDMSFSSSANLEIYKLDFQSDDRNLPLSGAIPSSEPFNRLSWGKSPSSGSEEFSLGLIAGGLVDGNIGIWNPRLLMSSEESENALVQQLSRHKGPVRGLEFSSLSPNHLASGAEGGEICIWDFAKPTEPTHFPPLKGSESVTHGEISFLSWNKKVQPILASTSFHGATVVWDLRKQKPIISFSDSVRRRCSVLQWHPDFATQLIVASDDDSSPSLRVMLYAFIYVAISESVIIGSYLPFWHAAMGYAEHNVTLARVLLQCHGVPMIAPICLLVPKTTALFAGTLIQLRLSLNFQLDPIGILMCTGIRSYLGSYRHLHLMEKLVFITLRLVLDMVLVTVTLAQVDVHDLVTEHSLVGTSSEIEAAMRSGERSSLRLLCDKKTQESESEDDREIWGFLKVMFEDDGTARTKLLNHLGFSLPPELNDTVQNDLVQDVSSLSLDKNEEAKEGYMEHNQTFNYPSDNGEDFFNNFPSPKADTPVSTSHNNFAIEESVPAVEDPTKGSDLQEGSADPSFDDAIQRALVVGDYKGAVAQCIAANKMADALVIAQIVAAMVNNDLVSLVNIRPLKSWKETLALLCTFAQRDEWTLLCDTLASRLMAADNTLAATLCYICSGNIDRTVEIWSKKVTAEHEGKSYVDLLQDLMEKTVVLALATGQKRFSASLCKLVEKYAEILASQGLLSTAMEYLKLMGTEDLSPEFVVLRDRIALSSEPEQNATVSTDFGYSQTHTGAVYGANQQTNSAVEPLQSYYQDEKLYRQEQYQPQPGPSYNNQYEQPQRSMFVPSPAAPSPPMGFNQPPVATQAAARPFVPMTPPIMRNADQYQQPPTLGSQLYPDAYQSQVNASSNYQAGPPGTVSLGPVPSPMVPTTGPKLPHDVSPTPPVRGFMPINNTPMQRTTSGQMPPNSATESAAPVAAPLPTVQTADTSNVPAQQRAVIGTLTRLFNETSEALGGSHAVPAKKREIDDNSKKIGALFAKLNNGDISKNAAEKLVQLCQALDRGDFPTALKIQVDLTTSDWDECSFWLATLKRMIRIRQNAR
ncbi:hypothetical protein Ccrd_021012 [Cynara cardunculus var. scolymus]|uniref:Uncharacterized protein n=1 Tax=Cynara cardunculus var. scolymus TaxID=59895 RepID=A0A103Y1D1_CYNCS|nr:hypothetical protein Ccrd_021012 [Cynara cardunculus var. scolymus]